MSPTSNQSNVQKDKEIFDVNKLPLEEFSTSLGLPGAPRIKFQKGVDIKALKNASRQRLSSSEDEADHETDALKKKGQVRTKYDRMFERRNQDVLSNHYNKLITSEDGNDGSHLAESEDEGAFLVAKKRGNDEDSVVLGGKDLEESLGAMPAKSAGRDPFIIDSKRREKLGTSKKALLKLRGKGKKLIFDDDGNAHEVYELEDESQFVARGPASEQRSKFLQSEAERVRTADQVDKQAVKDKKKERKEKKKAREAAQLRTVVQMRMSLRSFWHRMKKQKKTCQRMKAEPNHHRRDRGSGSRTPQRMKASTKPMSQRFMSRNLSRTSKRWLWDCCNSNIHHIHPS